MKRTVFFALGMWFTGLWLLSSCGNSGKNQSPTHIVWKKNSYATLFKVGTAEQDSFLEVYNDDGSMLGKFFWGNSDSVSGYRKITRRQRLVSMAAPYTYMLSELGLANRIVGVDNLKFIGHPTWLDLPKQWEDLSDLSELPLKPAYRLPEVFGESGELLPEKLMSVNPDLVFGFWVNPADQEFAEGMTKKRIPFVWCKNWLEAHPLGRSEWLIAFGWITGTAGKADSLYSQIRTRYQETAKQVQQIPKERRLSVAANIPYPNGMWFIPVESDQLRQLVADAGGDLVVLKKAKVFAPTPLEKAIPMMQNTDVWINIDLYDKGENLAIDYPQVKSIKAYKNRQVYHYNTTKNTFRNPYWDRGNLYCNELLSDLTAIFNRVRVETGGNAQPDQSTHAAQGAAVLKYYRKAF